jgi:hypothetical protein
MSNKLCLFTHLNVDVICRNGHGGDDNENLELRVIRNILSVIFF